MKDMFTYLGENDRQGVEAMISKMRDEGKISELEFAKLSADIENFFKQDADKRAADLEKLADDFSASLDKQQSNAEWLFETFGTHEETFAQSIVANFADALNRQDHSGIKKGFDDYDAKEDQRHSENIAALEAQREEALRQEHLTQEQTTAINERFDRLIDIEYAIIEDNATRLQELGHELGIKLDPNILGGILLDPALRQVDLLQDIRNILSRGGWGDSAKKSGHHGFSVPQGYARLNAGGEPTNSPFVRETVDTIETTMGTGLGNTGILHMKQLVSARSRIKH